MKLHIADNLIFPESVLDQHLVCLGKTGAGKSSALRHIVEHLLSRNKRVCVVDPKGDWNGLKVSADGKSDGFPVILFGDFKGDSIPSDVPLNEYSGKHVAELVTSGNRPCVIGMRGWTQGEMHRFWIDFASTFFNSNEGEMYLVVDEVHNFAPKGKVLSPEVGKSLHWTNRIMNEGRGIGLVNLIASQRPQKVHNDTLTACETLVAMRVVHKADRNAVEEWIEGCGDAAQGKEVLNALAGMERGEAYVWSPEVGFGPTRLRFPMFTTFDSFAPPQLQKKISQKGWAGVDLTEVKQKLAVVIEKAKAEDPKELQKVISGLRRDLVAAQKNLQPREQDTQRIKELEAELTKAKTATKTGPPKIVEKKIVIAGDLTRLEHFGEKLSALHAEAAERASDILTLAETVSGVIREAKALNEQNLIATPQPTISTVRSYKVTGVPEGAGPTSFKIGRLRETTGAQSMASSNGNLSGPMQKILNELAELEAVGISPADKAQLGLFCGYTNIKSGGFTGPLGKLREAEMVHYPGSGEVALTDRGRAQAAQPGQALTTSDLQTRIIQKLDGPRARVLLKLIGIYPGSIDKETLGGELGYTNVKSGGFTGPLGSLRKLGLIEYPQSGTVAASELLFPPGLS